MRYLANCPAGFRDVAAASLRLDLGDDLRVARIEDGFVVFDSGASPRHGGSVCARIHRANTVARWIATQGVRIGCGDRFAFSGNRRCHTVC